MHTVLHRLICDVFWGLGDKSYTIIIQYGYQMKGYDFLHLVLVVLTLRGFAQATYRSNSKKIVVGTFKNFFKKQDSKRIQNRLSEFLTKFFKTIKRKTSYFGF